MITSCFSRQFLLRKKPIDSFKNFSFFSTLRYSIPVFTCLILFYFSSELFSSLLLLVAILFFLAYSNSQHQNSSCTLPRLSSLHQLNCILHLLKNRTTARTKFLEMVFGACLCFANEGMFRFNILNKTYVVIYNPDIVETVLSSTKILHKEFPYNLAKDLLKKGLLSSDGSLWHSRRKLLTPAFHFRILKEFIPVFNKQAKSLVKKIENVMETQGTFDIVPLARLCTLSVILETAMGKRVDGEEDYAKEYVEALETWIECFARRSMFPFLWPDFIFFKTKIGKTSRKSMSIIEHFTRKVINERLQARLGRQKDMGPNDVMSDNENIGRKTKHQLALLDLLLDFHMQDKNTLSLQDIADEVDTFIFAGHDTTSSAISCALYLLGLHPDVQRNVQEEVDMVLGDDVDRMITDADIKKFKYLSCVLKEALRLFPTVPIIARHVQEDTVINGNKISKGTTVGISIYTVHRNQEIFPNPEIFDPERFNLENRKNMHPFAYIPFSAGPRNCIGQKFATNASIVILATVLRHFNVSSIEHRDKLKLVVDAVLTVENGLHLKFTRRQFLKNYSN